MHSFRHATLSARTSALTHGSHSARITAHHQPQGLTHSRHSYSAVQSGGGCFPCCPSPPNGRVAARILDREGVAEAARLARTMSVEAALSIMMQEPG